MSSVSSITDDEFRLFQKFIRDFAGIVLDDTKKNMAASRLQPVLDEYSFDTYIDLYNRASHSQELRGKICSALTTNETSFFRDPQVFDMFRDDFIPHFLNKSSSLKIWSAACSFGQEPYCLSMLLEENIPNIEKYDLRIEASDISNEAIAYASYGVYNKHEVNRGLDESRLFKHFSLEEKGFRVKDHIRYRVHFSEINILKNPPTGKKFDVILCRNVAIYFDTDTKKKLFDIVAERLNPGGRLIIGSTESLWQITDSFRRESYNGTIYYVLADDS